MYSVSSHSFSSCSSSPEAEVKKNIGECIVPRKIDSDKYTTQQERYVDMSGEACQYIIGKIESGSSFIEILEETGKKRQAIAVELKMGFEDVFGVLRQNQITDKITTPLLAEYASMLPDLLRIEKGEASMDWEVHSEDKSAFCFGFRTGVSCENERVKLSKYIFSGNEGMAKFNSIAHTYPENLEKVKKHCAHLYEQICSADSSVHSSTVKNMIAELHWWMSQGTFYKRGSAACAEIIVGALEFYKFGAIAPYKSGIFADRIALVSSCEDFVRLYPTLREE